MELDLADERTPFIRNAWYVAALSADVVAGKPFARKLLGEGVVLFRTGDGTIAALRDRCPHRAFPLSQGTIDGDEIVCGYHGIHYDRAGRCTRIPSQPAVPRGFAVRCYPTLERAPLVWIWMGEAGRADAKALPSQPWMEDRVRWTASTGYLHMKASYVHLHENLLDLTHLSFLHARTFGTPDYASAPYDTEIDEPRIVVRRTVQPTHLPPVYARPLQMEGVRAARIVTSTFFAPAISVSAVALRNLEVAESERVDYQARTAHLLTPETADSMHYHFLVGRDFALQDRETDEFMTRSLGAAFKEDVWALEHITAVRRDEPDPLYADRSVAADKAGVAVRRYLARLARGEQRFEQTVSMGGGS